jgi:hypothetical protein
VTGDWHKICAEEYETAEAESFGALAGWCYGNNEIPPKLTEVLTEALRTAFAGAFNHGYEACIGSPPDALSAPSEPVPDGPRVWAGPGCCRAAYESDGHAHDHPMSPRVWAMPELPEDVSAVRDRNNYRWIRCRENPALWCYVSPTLEHSHLRGAELLTSFGPLTEVVEP